MATRVQSENRIPDTLRDASKAQYNPTEIIYGSKGAVEKGVQFMKNTRHRMDIYFDRRAPSIVTQVREYWDGYSDIRARGGAIRLVTDITKENLCHCKEIMKLAEVRHLDSIKGGLAVNESEYMATTVLEEGKPLSQVLYSNAKEQVEQGRYIFEIIWKNAIPAGERISEIENNIERLETRVITNPEEIFQQIANHLESARGLSIVTEYGGLQLAHKKFFDMVKNAASRSEGEGQSIRWVLTISKENVRLIRAFLAAGIKIRHARDLAPINFAVSDSRVNATVDKMKEGKIMQSMMTSTEPVYVNHFKAIFDDVWRRGVDAEERIREIARGIEPASLSIMQDPADVIRKAGEVMRGAKDEILLLLPTENSLRRVMRIDNGAMFNDMPAKRDHAPVLRFLVRTPDNSAVVREAQRLLPDAQFSILHVDLHSLLTIIVVDQKECMMVEVKDDSANVSMQAIGTTVYSSSRSFVSSYHTILKSLWNEKMLFDELKENKQKQQDFINVAAHELRNPIQPILAVSQILRSRVSRKSTKSKNRAATTIARRGRPSGTSGGRGLRRRNAFYASRESSATDAALCDVIYRNTVRLKNLSDNILDMARIEGQGLKLNYEIFDLGKSIGSAVVDARRNIRVGRKKIRILYAYSKTYVNADRTRIMQVVHNLLDNAVKFTEKGTIKITVTKAADRVTVRVKDSGVGIDPSMLHRVFQKFVTTSIDGAGLGLFICDKIIRAHNGRIWAFNNRASFRRTGSKAGREGDAGRGATVAFFIPKPQKSLLHTSAGRTG